MVLAGLLSGCVSDLFTRTDDAALSGGIFTTRHDGERVNQNLFDAKEDVYLDGGPGDGAPGDAGALDEGDYYFQVTDPSGMTLLSSDAITCRSFHISADGVIDAVYTDTDGCVHQTGVDADHAELGAITIQLMPYADTPNPGGEYKVWVTPVGDYAAGEGKHGFLPSKSKTDNFKVRATTPPPEPFCGDGTVDDGEQCDDGNTEDGDGCSANCTDEVEPPPEPVCGNGVIEPGEQCDDGNTDDHDGCSNSCTIST